MLRLLLWLSCAGALAASALAAPPRPAGCLGDCAPRIGVVSAFGAEADILLAQTLDRRVWTINGRTFTTGRLRGNRVVIVLSGVSMINATLVTQEMLDHFRIERLIMSGIAGGIDPSHHVGDLVVPDRWAMPMEVYWNADAAVPSACGAPGDIGCLGLKLATDGAGTLAPFDLGGSAGALFVRDNAVLDAATAPKGEFRFDYPVDAEMLEVVRRVAPVLERCGPRARTAAGSVDPTQCVSAQPQVVVGGRGVSGTAFLANAAYRSYLSARLQAQTVDMETAALAHVARTNGVPYIAFRSLSDLAGATAFDADVRALFTSGLAERNEAAMTLAFLEAWAARARHR